MEKRDVLRAATRSSKGTLQRQVAFFIGSSAVLLSFYGVGGDDACKTLEGQVPQSLKQTTRSK